MALALSVTTLFSTTIMVRGVESYRGRKNIAREEMEVKHRTTIVDHMKKHFPNECQKGVAYTIDSGQNTNLTGIVYLINDDQPNLGNWPHIYLPDQEKSIRIGDFTFSYSEKGPNLSKGNGVFIIVAPTKKEPDNRFVIKNEKDPTATPPKNAAEYYGNQRIKLTRKGDTLNVFNEYNQKITEFKCTQVLSQKEQKQMVAKPQSLAYQPQQKPVVSAEQIETASLNAQLAQINLLKEKQEREDEEAVRKVIAASRQQAQFDAEYDKAIKESLEQAQLQPQQKPVVSQNNPLLLKEKQEREKQEKEYQEALQKAIKESLQPQYSGFDLYPDL